VFVYTPAEKIGKGGLTNLLVHTKALTGYWSHLTMV